MVRALPEWLSGCCDTNRRSALRLKQSSGGNVCVCYQKSQSSVKLVSSLAVVYDLTADLYDGALYFVTSCGPSGYDKQRDRRDLYDLRICKGTRFMGQIL
ncbi:hypothetical protein J6590_048650 [Homalodisca vitripennis]|nr:hypothetical protein J6590_048650 [Homalodisca vitripennis]